MLYLPKKPRTLAKPKNDLFSKVLSKSEYLEHLIFLVYIVKWIFGFADVGFLLLLLKIEHRLFRVFVLFLPIKRHPYFDFVKF